MSVCPSAVGVEDGFDGFTPEEAACIVNGVLAFSHCYVGRTPFTEEQCLAIHRAVILELCASERKAHGMVPLGHMLQGVHREGVAPV